MSEHTPGPWEVREGPNDSRAFDVFAGGWKIHHGAWGRQADALLIAAAPDLLAVVKDFRQKLATYRNVYEGDKELRRQLKDCDAAILKAEGK